MLFNSLEYVTFLLVVFGLYWATVRYARVALGVLLAASLVFYASWNAWYLSLIIATTLVDFTIGGRLARGDPRWRKTWLWTSVAYNLGILGLFKYFNFFMGQADSVLGWAGLDAWAIRLDVLLPVGISFFTFQSMSYTIDIYRGRLEPIGSYPRYLLYVSFFPQLVAGPIVRARDLLPQLANRPALTDAMGGRGLFLIMLGLFKKVVVADYLALNIVDRTFGSPLHYTSVEMLAGVYAYALQIYCDFSGYSDIAIGSALLLGFTFPDNFDAPYKARNLQAFWRRWHISLSSWLRDYLYISLGGSRGGAWRTYRNLAVTMLLGGLWHGAGWNFIVWGALHGFALALLRMWQRRRDAAGREPLLRGWLGGAVATFITFHYVCFAWVFFRTPDLQSATAVLTQLTQLSVGAANLTPHILAVMAVGFVTHFWPRRAFDALVAGFIRLHWAWQGLALVAVGLALRALATTDVVPFIYFQF